MKAKNNRDCVSMSMSTPVERTAILCALLAVLALAHRARLLAVIVATAGIALLGIQDTVRGSTATDRFLRQRACFAEHYDDDKEEKSAIMAAATPESPPPPPPDPLDDDYRRGIIIGEHGGRPYSHRFAVPRRQPPAPWGEGDCLTLGDAQAADRNTRNRMLYRVPLNFKPYRSSTGRLSHLSIYN